MELKPGFKKTEVGVIPEDWDIALIGDLGTVVRGSSPRPAGDPRYFNGDFIPWLTVASLTNISENQLCVSETVGYLTEEGAKRSRIINNGTLIIANSGATLGIAKILGITCCANDGIAAIINQKTGDKEFACHYINSKTKYLREVVATGNGQPNLNTTLIRELPLPFPSEKEQRAIAAALSDVDALLAKLDQLIAKKRDLKQATMQQLLTGRTRLPGFSGEWVATQLGEILDVLADYTANGSFEALKNNVTYYESTNYAVLVRTTDLDKSKFVPERFTDEKGYRFLSKTSLFGGEIIIANVGSIGKVFRAPIFDMPMTLAPNTYLLKFNKRINESFIYQWMNTEEFYLKLMSKIGSTTLQAINKENLRSIELRYPSKLAEQTAIAAILSDMDAEIAALEARRDKTQRLKHGMMQELLTGRIRLIDPEDLELNALADARLADGLAPIKVSLDDL